MRIAGVVADRRGECGTALDAGDGGLHRIGRLGLVRAIAAGAIQQLPIGETPDGGPRTEPRTVIVTPRLPDAQLELDVAFPSAGLYVKLRDDPAVVNLVTLPAEPLPVQKQSASARQPRQNVAPANTSQHGPASGTQPAANPAPSPDTQSPPAATSQQVSSATLGLVSLTRRRRSPDNQSRESDGVAAAA